MPPSVSTVASSLTALLAALNSLSLAQPSLPTVYVDDDAPPGGDGTSWNSAYRDLRDALVDQHFAPFLNIHIAQGVYTPDRGSGDRTAAFAVASAVTLIGGFAGLGAANPDEHDPARFVSVLSGDLRRDDGPNFGNRSDNSFHVIDASGADGPGILRSLTIRGGHADGDQEDQADRGGAIFGRQNRHCSIELHDCRVTDNFARNDAAAVSVPLGWVSVHDSQIDSNETSGSGASVAITSRDVFAWRTRFTGNISSTGAASVSAIAASSAALLNDCVIDANDRTIPAVACSHGSIIERCTFVANGSAQSGSLRYAATTNLVVRGSIFHSGDAKAPPGVQIVATQPYAGVVVQRSCIEGGRDGVSAYRVEWNDTSIDANPRFVAVAGKDDDLASWQDNNYTLGADSPCVDAAGSPADPVSYGPARFDAAGQPRYVSAQGNCVRRADMGAFENQDVMPVTPVPVLYVNASAPAGGDGLTWGTALTDLDAALVTRGVREIWIASGVYTPGVGSFDYDRAYDVQCEVRIFGGFSGHETSPDERDPLAPPTILSGDVLGNDDGTPEGRFDNSQHILQLHFADAVIDGVIIENGYTRSTGADEGGAGVLMYDSSVTLTRCEVRGCFTDRPWAAGAGVSATDSNLLIKASRFHANSIDSEYQARGAAIHALHGNIAVVNSVFTGNAAVADYIGVGGAVSIVKAASATISECEFVSNRTFAREADASSYGGALAIDASDVAIISCTAIGNESVATNDDAWATAGAATISGENVTIANSLFAANRSVADFASVGAVAFSASAAASISGCTFAENASVSITPLTHPGALIGYFNPGVECTIANSIFWNNRNVGGSGYYAQLRADDATITSCCIQGWNGSYPGENIIATDPLFAGIGDFRLADGSPCIDRADAAFLALDITDLDRDGDVAEPMPFDLAGSARVVGPSPDLGAFENQSIPCRADYKPDGTLNSHDFFTFVTDFFNGMLAADFNQDGVTTPPDFFDFLTAFFAGCA